MNKQPVNFKKATILVAFLFSQISSAARVENHKDIIEKAYNLSLQKNRAQATQLLVSAVRKEGKKSQAVKELLQALDEVATIFYSEKAQQQFELALSLRMSEPQAALSKISEALKLENDNLSIIVEQLRLMIAAGDCSAAVSQGKKARESNPYSQELALAYAQAAICAGQLESYVQTKSISETRKTPLSSFWLMIEAEHLFKTNAFSRARELAVQITKTSPRFPEPYYWQWKIDTEQKIKTDKMGQKYISLCRSIGAREARSFFPEPHLCQRITEVENALKKNNNLE